MNSLQPPFVTGLLPEAQRSLPVLWLPRTDGSVAGLAAWVSQNRATVEKTLLDTGGILVRGFDVRSADDVETLAAAFVPDLGQDYLGTSPRHAVTPRVFNASELPGYYPIPQHCEMTFVAQPPRRIFFSCLVEPAAGSGETPITDFQAVAAGLPADVRARFEQRDLRLIRNYTGPGHKGRDLWQLKPWHEMFGTTDRDVVSERCRNEGFEAEWVGNDGLRLVSYHKAFHPHPQTGATIWFNHLQVFHLAAGPMELQHIAKMRPSVRSRFWSLAAGAMGSVKSRRPSIEQSMHMTWANGDEIAHSDLKAVMETIWANQVVFPWKKGDFLALDNRRVSHGRLPYRGPRKVVVAWS
jgi:alpha-ketoglutarate-dependent taurine dioxygenase